MSTVISSAKLSQTSKKFFNETARVLINLSNNLFQDSSINFFVFGRFYKNGKSVLLTTHPEVMQFHLDKNFGFIDEFPLEPQSNQLLFCPKDTDIYGKNYDSVKEIFNHSNPIDFVEFYPEHFDFYCYASKKDTINPQGFYLNHLERLKFQNFFIKKQALNLLKKAEADFYFDIPALVAPGCFQYCREYIPEKILLAQTFLQSHYQLTARETEILKFHSYGASNKDIANDLSLSVKTIDSHIANIKYKVNIDRKYDLIKFYLELIV